MKRREFLNNAIVCAGGLGLAGFVNRESNAQTQDNSPTQENQPNNTIDTSQFPREHIYYTSPVLQPNQNPKLANKSDLEKATPAQRRINQKRYGINDGEYWVLKDKAQKEIYRAVEKVSEREGVSFVGDINYFQQLWETRQENAKIPEEKRKTLLNLFLSDCDITPLIYSDLASQTINEEV